MVEEFVNKEKIGEKGTILVVDDEENILTLYGRYLQPRGYKIITAINGDEAIKIYNEKFKEIDLVILDRKMPGKSGEETFLKMKEINPNIKSILFTGETYSDDVKRIKGLGIGAVLPKPFSKSLIEVVESTLSDGNTIQPLPSHN